MQCTYKYLRLELHWELVDKVLKCISNIIVDQEAPDLASIIF